MKITVTYVNYSWPGAGFAAGAEITAQEAAKSLALIAAMAYLGMPATALAADGELTAKVTRACATD